MPSEPQDDKNPRKGRPSEFTPAGARGDDPITRNLKKVYEEVAAEPIPQNLQDLLDKLAASVPDGEKSDG